MDRPAEDSRPPAPPVAPSRTVALALTVDARAVVRVLVFLVVVLGLLGTLAAFVPDDEGAALGLRAFRRLFDLDAELNVPTWFSSAVLLIAAGLCAVVAADARAAGGPYVRHWQVLAGLLLVMSLDETAAIHETTLRPLRMLLPSDGIFYITYVIPGLVVAVVVGLAFVPFLRHLPPPIRWYVVGAGGLYVGSAVGMEMLEGRHQALYGTGWSLVHTAMTIVEEVGEMSSVVLLVHALLGYVALRAAARTSSGGEAAAGGVTAGVRPRRIAG